MSAARRAHAMAPPNAMKLRAQLDRANTNLIATTAEAAELRHQLEALRRDLAPVVGAYLTRGLTAEAVRAAVGVLVAKRISAGDRLVWGLLP